ncbi:hypothetical protein DSUL_60009 [Desulfovibrionales bacterium]
MNYIDYHEVTATIVKSFVLAQQLI